MRKELLKGVREELNKLLPARCGFFKRSIRYREPGRPDVYVWNAAPELSFFVYLLPNPKSYKDSFMIELGWSKGGPPPLDVWRNKEKEHLDPQWEGRIRMPKLWREQWRSALEPWWELGESLGAEDPEQFYSEAETQRRSARIPAVVTDVVNRIERYAVPFFQRIARERGLLE